MKIYRAEVADAPKLAQVHVDSWQVAYRGLVPDSHLQGFTYQKREAAFRRALAEALEETYLIEADDHPVGILTIGPSRDADLDEARTGEIWGIYVTPTHWHQGIGTRLVQEAEGMLKARGYQDIVLWVLESNSAARCFYEAMGFNPDGASKTVVLGEPLEAIRYKKAAASESPA